MLYVPQNIAEAATLLALAFASVALLITGILIFWPRPHGIEVKLLGSLMVLALAFAANNWGVYALSTFIVATIVTELDFLEKLAAIFWNRNKYWEYRIQSAAATEFEAKRTKEVEADLASEGRGIAPDKIVAQPPYQSSLANIRRASMAFERAVLDALQPGRGPISPARIFPELKISSDLGSVLLDAVIESADVRFVVEIKYLRRPSGLLNALHQIERGLMAYRNYLRERRIHDRVVPVLVVPDALNSPSLFRDVLPILKFDQEASRFTNVDQFFKAVEMVEPNALWLQD